MVTNEGQYGLLSSFCFLTNREEIPDEIDTQGKRQKHMKYVPYGYTTSK